MGRLFVDAKFTGVAQGMADTALGFGGRDHDAVGPLAEQASEHIDSRCRNSVIVAYDDLRSHCVHA
jgi:hypothetical protein